MSTTIDVLPGEPRGDRRSGPGRGWRRGHAAKTVAAPGVSVGVGWGHHPIVGVCTVWSCGSLVRLSIAAVVLEFFEQILVDGQDRVVGFVVMMPGRASR